MVDALPVITPSASSISVQYADPISAATITINDDGAGSSLTAATQWKLNSASSYTSVLPFDHSLNEKGTAGTHSRTWELSGIAKVAPGNTIIRVTVSYENCSAYIDLPLTVTPENVWYISFVFIFQSKSDRVRGYMTAIGRLLPKGHEIAFTTLKI
jgi:hypothetical protein